MKTPLHYLIATSVCLAVLASCAAPKTVGRTDFGVPWKLEWLDQTARAQLEVGDIWSTYQSDIKTGLAEVRNRQPIPIRVRVGFRWLGQYGTPLNTPGSVPQLLELKPGESKVISNVAPSPRAHSFQIRIGLAK
ncbi:MAG: DUF1425 domain-containing protein [Planctomycetota bacterium]|jgi:uncharacterized protein YcfL|nr:DUF1425 domain-containing protein [Planctomycetota bacterium]